MSDQPPQLIQPSPMPVSITISKAAVQIPAPTGVVTQSMVVLIFSHALGQGVYFLTSEEARSVRDMLTRETSGLVMPDHPDNNSRYTPPKGHG